MRSAVDRWSQQLFLVTAVAAVLAVGVRAGAQEAGQPVADPFQATQPSQDPASASAEPADSGADPSSSGSSAEQPRPTPAAKPQSGEKPPEKVSATSQPSAESPESSPESSSDTSPTTKAPKDGEKLTPIPDAAEAGEGEIEVASFNGVTPGVTTLAEVEKAWGPPKEINRQGAALLHLYSVDPFDRVEVSISSDKVTSIVIRLAKAFPASAVAEQLALTNVRPVVVSNDLGEVLGQAYPERGVMFSFEPSAESGKATMSVAQIVLEPISAEPFVLRAETNLSRRYQASQKDLEQALKLAPDNARAHWLHSRVLVAMGDFEKAAAASDRAVRIEPANAQYRVTHAQILSQVGRLAEAIQEAEKAVQTSEQRPHIKARALCVLGDLHSSAAKPDHRRALKYHTEAVTTADALGNSRHPAIRLAAKEVLVDAHLGAAHAIAWGDWKEKEVAVDRWLGRAEAFAGDLVKSEGDNQEYQFRVCARALAACVGVRGAIEPSKWVKEATLTGEHLIAAADDPVRKAQFQWDLGMALYDALQIYQMRSAHDTALKYGESAVAYLAPGGEQGLSPSKTYLVGRLYFRLGAIYAIRDKNHRTAVSWFDKAAPLLDKPLPKEASSDVGRHGETFVSMAVSYWEAGQHEKAVELTERGVELMQQAVKLGALDESALSVPYGNLAAMHRHLGRIDQATRFEEMAGRGKDTKLR